jgi:hypothetical protein
LEPERLLAGAAASNISPPLGVSLNGGMQDRAATHIHDELHARAVVLKSGSTQAAIVVCDSCMLPRTILDRAKQLAHTHTGIPLDHILISATHSHTAPTAAGVFQSEPDAAYIEFLITRISDVIRRAAHNLAPARIGWGSGELASQVFNRRWRMRDSVSLIDPFGRPERVKMNPPVASPELLEPAGPTDPQIGVLSIQRPDGSPLAVLANYSLHYVGGAGAGDVSADYFGAFARRLATKLDAEHADPAFVAIMSNGTSGNINNINFRERSEARPPYVQINHVAELAASEVARVVRSIEHRDRVPIDMRQASLRLARRRTPPDEVAKARYLLSQAGPGQLTGLAQIYARETVLLNEYPPFVETLVQALRIGELGIVTSPCETFVETGLAIKAKSPLKPTFVIELANDYCGYLPTTEHHELGGYETWRARSSFLEVDAEARLRATMLELLEAVARA